jgi:pilus assembly protein CpaD
MTKARYPIRSHVPRLLAVGALTVLLAGCYQPRTAQRDYPDDYRQRHPITLKEGQRTVEVFLGHGGLTPAQRADVMAFAAGWRREGTGGIVIDMPKGGPSDRAAAESMREIGSILAASGVQRNVVYVRTYTPSSTSLASIKIAYAKLVAEAGPCGLWPADLGPSFDPSYNDNKPYWNLGCSTQRNLAAMVDNPADLVQPRGETPAYAGRRSVAIDKFRKGDNPSGTYTGYDTGKISDLGK